MMLPDATSLVYQAPLWQSVHSAWAEHLPAAFWLSEQLRPRSFVELGSHAGDSYCTFAQAMAALGLDGEGAQAMAVDTWEGDEHSHRYGTDIYEALAAHHDPLYAHFSRLNKALFDHALADIEDKSVDLLHIDGLHTYEAVKHDFESWLPKLSERGVVLFHDVTETKDDFGVWQLWDELKLRFSHLLLPHGHGLGIIAVGNQVPVSFSSKLSAAGSDELSESQQALIAFLHGLGQACEQKRLRLVEQQTSRQLRDEKDRVIKEYSDLEQTLQQARQEHRATEAHLQQLQNSASWKLSKPLRKLKGGE